MLRNCKKTLMALVGNRRLTDDVLSTTMCLVEQKLNSRTLTSVSDDPEDLEALTPNHFLLGRASHQLHSFLTLSDIQICAVYSEYRRHLQT